MDDKFEIPKLKVLSFSSVHKIQSFILTHQLLPVLIVLSLVGVGASGYLFYNSTTQSVKGVSTGQTMDKNQVKKLIDEVGKIMNLPQGEDPNVATVTDIEKLKDQPFFADGKNGDQVLLYTNAKKVILYDPQNKKIVNVAPLVANAPTPAPTQNQARIVLLNGTSKVGLAAKIEAEIKKDFPQANIVSKENSTKDNYEKTIVVVLNQSAKDASINLAKALNVSVGELPSGENKPTGVDILIIIGKDKI